MIIDQPEDDLDNQVILEIVENIWNAKARRQLIFASHSANLVVNGDAELVVSFDYRVSGDVSGGKASSEGAIDVPATNAVIKRVMEGGEEAFKLRKAKHGFLVRRTGLHTCSSSPTMITGKSSLAALPPCGWAEFYTLDFRSSTQ